MSFHLSFIFILQFHHSRASLLAPIHSSLSFPALLFFIISPSLPYSVSHSGSLFFFLSLSLSYQPSLALSLSLRLAVFIFQSFISTNVRQCFCPPSIDPQREKECGEREAGRKGGEKAATRNEVEREIKREEWKIWKKGEEAAREQGWGERRKKEECKEWEKCRATMDWLRLSPPFFSNSIPLLSPPCLLIVHKSLHQLKYRYQDKKNSRWTHQQIIRQAERGVCTSRPNQSRVSYLCNRI